jgi:O-antigen/teichoic acid export membrane protein
MLVSLYTVRVVLETLGAEDYGIYNVVAGVVAMFGFLSSSMANASQRYFAYEIGRKDFEQLKKVFSLNITIYALIGILVLIMAKTAGLWFVNNKLVIPPDRISAARLIYQFSIISFLCSIIVSPFMADIIAHEDMNIYAYISIAEVVLKLGVIFVLRIIPFDKLQLYGLLLSILAFVNMIIYTAICKVKYQECKFRFYWDKTLFKEIAGFLGWNLFGSIAGIAKNQGINILLNLFFGPLINAARSISIQVDNAVKSFSQNFIQAVRPQITKEYAAGNYDEMNNLVFRSAKLSFFLVLLFFMPLLFEMSYIMKIWLKNPPPYTAIFLTLTLIDTLFESVSYPIMYIAQATGKIKLYQSVVSGVLLLNLFFGPLINAARSISIQVDSAVKSFSQNFIQAVLPQITKEYAAGNYDEMNNLVFRSAKLSFFLVLLFFMPLLFEMSYIMKIWLKNPPPYTAVFLTLTLIDTLLDSVNYPIMYIAQATGKIKLYQSVVSGTLLLNIPVSFIIFKMGFPPYTAMIIAIFLTITAFFLRLVMIKRLVSFSIIQFSKLVIIPAFIVFILSGIVPLIITNMFNESFLRLCASVILGVSITVVFIYAIGLTKQERYAIIRLIRNKINIGNR